MWSSRPWMKNCHSGLHGNYVPPFCLAIRRDTWESSWSSSPPIPGTCDIPTMHCSSDVMGSVWNPLFVSFPCKRTSSGFPFMAEFTAVLLLSTLFHSNLPQILLSLNHIILSPGLQIALYLITLSLCTFPTSPYTILLFVYFIPAIWSLRASLATSLAYWPLPCHFLDLKSLPFTLYLALWCLGLSWNVTFLERLSVHTLSYTGVPSPPLWDHPVLLHSNKFENM